MLNILCNLQLKLKFTFNTETLKRFICHHTFWKLGSEKPLDSLQRAIKCNKCLY